MSVVVRAAAPDDAAAIDAVRFASWQAAYGHLIPGSVFADWDPAALTERMRAALTAGIRRGLVAETDGAVVGFCTYGACRDDDLPEASEVYAIYARPDHWSTGVGRALLGSALGDLGASAGAAAGAAAGRPIVLWVLRDNARARRFYEIAGFTPDGTTRDTALLGGGPLPELRYRLA